MTFGKCSRGYNVTAYNLYEIVETTCRNRQGMYPPLNDKRLSHIKRKVHRAAAQAAAAGLPSDDIINRIIQSLEDQERSFIGFRAIGFRAVYDPCETVDCREW
jgi:hypothetical protein